MSAIVKVIKDMFYLGLEKFGRYYSIYRAFVADNKDPMGYGRLNLIIPGIADNPNTYWAWQKSRYAGPGYGSQCIPEIGDVVWVEFELGDPNKPIWSHGHFAKPDLEGLPDEFKDIQNYWFRTPGKHTIQIDDKNNLIKVTHGKSEISLVINETGLSIVLPNKTQMFLGSLDKAAEPVTKADTAAEIFNAQLDMIGKVAEGVSSMGSALSTFTSTMALALTPAQLLSNTKAGAPALMKSIKDTIDSNVLVNESITDNKNAIPGIKSNKVSTD